MKPCACTHAKSRHEAWGLKHPGKCLVQGCPCTVYRDEKQGVLL